jgi:hypothetical protein
MVENNKYRAENERLEIRSSKRENGHAWVVLKSSKLKPTEISKYEHDTAKADLYVALHSIASEWWNEYPLGGGQLVSDVSFTYQNRLFHVELDLGNMESERLFNKIERYVSFCGPEKVIFVLRDGRYKATVTGTQIINYCKEQKLGHFITAATFENFCEFPTGKVLISTENGEFIRLSINDLI